ncbi:branched-chain amino acid ABC transporter substrate-binding protein [Burkholderia stabilis]|uniref:ABC transporter substrate-binding protein n=1 Tax=Burkholderia stabilis TaxID=95485 RepID=UPI000851708B|nr:ABC transporter substrate-binding protein [Burkholderia stabilis]AOR68981.1 branched-chain amino acid ABC transporter substrate-binding protein [Burkholderia stabilis]HDR9493724.1 ABC transporter substrate-binding protein [Burkholderia stabilis]HDR9523248.1 ABC transporter substrate-binding protein [Burkholderia stabilis]HDR9531270.1 ABC transporter substrate-binding protein [Burkholderia stabilis]HDR9538333.1 ABC transporter substrate-binding protein [Burkholderia stabilis]
MTLPALLRRAAGTALALACAAAHADLKVGVDLSSTGPAAAIGITSKNAILMWPKTIAGQPLQVTVLDDASDPGAAVRNIRKLVDEDHVDVVVGPNITPAALAALDAVAAGQTPMVTLVGSGAIVEPQEGARTWAFKMAQSDRAMADVMTRYMANHGVKTVGFIGFADSYGDSWLNEFTRFADLRKIRVVAAERFNRTDASVTGQALKLIAAKPDAILIAGSGTPAVLPQRTLIERGYKGAIYQTHGIATPEFIKLGGKDVDGTLFPTQPVVVARTLPADHPARKAALAFVDAYEAKYGAGTVTQFAGDAAGVYPRLADAVGRALKAAQPGTPAFRAALRRELEHAHELVVPNGVVNTSDKDHVGLDQRASVMGIVKQGRFVYLSQ